MASRSAQRFGLVTPSRVARTQVRNMAAGSLTADRDSFGAAVAEIDRHLQERIEHLVRVRERIAQLSVGDRLFVSPEGADYLDRLREIGVSQRAVQLGYACPISAVLHVTERNGMRHSGKREPRCHRPGRPLPLPLFNLNSPVQILIGPQ